MKTINREKSPPIEIKAIGLVYIFGASAILLVSSIGLVVQIFSTYTILVPSRQILFLIIGNILKIFITAIAIILAIFLIKLHRWARNWLEVLSWICIIYYASSIIIGIFRILSSKLDVPTLENSIPHVLIKFSFIMHLIMKDGIWAIPLIILLLILRRTKIKKHF